jgi:uncharacterized oxidoreductase
VERNEKQVNAVLLESARLTEFVALVCESMGAQSDVALVVAEHLVLASSSGHESHGLARLARYVEAADRGALHPAARPEVLSETPVSAVIDAHHGFGQYSTMFALELALRKAGEVGIGMAAVRHSAHTGRLGTYAEAAVRAGYVYLSASGGAGRGYGLAAPYGGRERFLSTNPWTIAIPAGPGREPFVFDAATTTIAQGKNMVARDTGAAMMAGALLDAAGQPTTDPAALQLGGSLTLLGSPVAGHKGFGFSLAAALLGGLAMIEDPRPAMGGDGAGFQGVGGLWMLVLSPALFGDGDRYRAAVGRVLHEVHGVPPIVEGGEPRYPGEPEAAARAAAAVGVPVPERVVGDLFKVAGRFGLADRLSAAVLGSGAP